MSRCCRRAWRTSPAVSHAYLNGRADSAVDWLDQRAAASPQWTEAHMALGEVYYHLLPAVRRRRSTRWPRRSSPPPPRTPDSRRRASISPSSRSGAATDRAKQAVRGFMRLAQDDASSDQRMSCVLMLALRAGRARRLWSGRTDAGAALHVLAAAKLLAGGGAFPGCAEDGFRAVFDDTTASSAIVGARSWGYRGSCRRGADLRAQGHWWTRRLAHGLDLGHPAPMSSMRLGSGGRMRKRHRSWHSVSADPEGIFVCAAGLRGSGMRTKRRPFVATKSVRDSLAARAARKRRAGIKRHTWRCLKRESLPAAGRY